jgi:hypothetical protein
MKNQMQVQTDSELEKDAEHPVGRICHLSTVTHAWRGTLLHVTPSYYVLAPGAVMVGDTGDIGPYLAAGKTWPEGAEESDPTDRVVRVLRAAVSWMASE